MSDYERELAQIVAELNRSVAPVPRDARESRDAMPAAAAATTVNLDSLDLLPMYAAGAKGFGSFADHGRAGGELSKPAGAERSLLSKRPVR